MKPADLADEMAPTTTAAMPSAALPIAAGRHRAARFGRLAVLVATALIALTRSGLSIKAHCRV